MRKVIQISNSVASENDWSDDYRVIVALCDDGSIFEHRSNVGEWSQLPPIPQPKIADEVVMPEIGESIFICDSLLSSEEMEVFFKNISSGYIYGSDTNNLRIKCGDLWRRSKPFPWRDSTGKVVEV